MRAVECPCGEFLHARNDHELLESARRHASQAHAGEGQYSETDLRILVDTKAYDHRERA